VRLTLARDGQIAVSPRLAVRNRDEARRGHLATARARSRLAGRGSADASRCGVHRALPGRTLEVHATSPRLAALVKNAYARAIEGALHIGVSSGGADPAGLLVELGERR
jgi:hypothetical protein